MATLREQQGDGTASSRKKPKPNATEPPKAGAGENLTTFFRGIRTEWQKISWPTWPQVWGQTLVVLVMVTIVSLGLYAVDNLFRFVIGLLTGGRA